MPTDVWEAPLKRVLRFFNRKDAGGYAFCVAEDQRDIVQINHLLKEHLNNNLTVLTLKAESDQSLLSQFQASRATIPQAPIVVTNLEEVLKAKDQDRLLELNFSREALNRLQRPILFWVNLNRLSQIANEAADLFSQRQFGTLIFSKKESTHEENQVLAKQETLHLISEEESENLWLKVSNLENQLAVSQTLDPVFVAENIALPLALTYSQLYQHDKALNLIIEWEKQLPTNQWKVCYGLGEIYNRAGYLEQALTYFSKTEEILVQSQNEQNNLGEVYRWLGNTQLSLGNLEKALAFFEEMNKLFAALYARNPTNLNVKNNLAISYSKLGETQLSLGQMTKALELFEEYNRLEKELSNAYPIRVGFKNSLAISYQFLGETHNSLGHLDKALTFYEEFNKLMQELFTGYPKNVRFKNGLAISYQFLGRTHNSIGNLGVALAFFEEYNRLEMELNDAYPRNVGFKNGLAISYQFLGETHDSLGNKDKALSFFEEYNRLEKELYNAYPTNVGFKNALAISYLKLGETQLSLGNMDKSLAFLEVYNRLEKELCDTYPTNVAFKNGLAISYLKLGDFYKNSDKPKAKDYFLKGKKLLEELSNDFPSYIEFKNNLSEISVRLNDIK